MQDVNELGTVSAAHILSMGKDKKLFAAKSVEVGLSFPTDIFFFFSCYLLTSISHNPKSKVLGSCAMIYMTVIRCGRAAFNLFVAGLVGPTIGTISRWDHPG